MAATPGRPTARAIAARTHSRSEASRACASVIVAEGDDAGNAYEIADKIAAQSDYDLRVAVLGYIQRGGSPSAVDRVQGGLFAKTAVDALAAGETAKLVAMRNGATTLVELELAWKETRQLPAHLMELAGILAS